MIYLKRNVFFHRHVNVYQRVVRLDHPNFPTAAAEQWWAHRFDSRCSHLSAHWPVAVSAAGSWKTITSGEKERSSRGREKEEKNKERIYLCSGLGLLFEQMGIAKVSLGGIANLTTSDVDILCTIIGIAFGVAISLHSVLCIFQTPKNSPYISSIAEFWPYLIYIYME